MEDPRGGVRHVIPSKGNYRKDQGKLDEAWDTQVTRQCNFDF